MKLKREKKFVLDMKEEEETFVIEIPLKEACKQKILKFNCQVPYNLKL
jgi:hypothetical protein